MRRVQINQIQPGMVLAKSVYNGENLILSKGTSDIGSYIDGLQNYGIFSVYVEDEISDGILISDVVKEETRNKCKKALEICFKNVINQGGFDEKIIDDTINEMISDLLSREDVILSLYDISTKDDSTLVHSVNTAVYSMLAGRQMGFDRKELKELTEAALFHDIGKVLISSQILLKNGKLTSEEFVDMKNHTTLGYNILMNNTKINDTTRIVALQHHERLDGSGYPSGLKSDAIHIYSKIVAIADVYDALTAERCYRKSMSNYTAYNIISNDAGLKYDSNILGKFMKNVTIYPNGTIVNLSDGTHGIVKSQNRNNLFRPIIRVIDDRDKENLKLYDLNLLNESNIDIITK